MHGRVKVKTTAQQDAEKKAQRQEKLEAYQKAMKFIFDMRKSLKVEKSPKMMTKQLKATQGVLLANPDITTLWNIRKEMLEIVISFFEHFAPANIQDHDNNLKKELDLTFQCLQTNPKSYGAWHHRCWSMLKMKNPNWDNEIGLCNKYLSLDERNFHCWDYRRFVVKNNENVSLQDEVDYSYEKIEDKIENYSAWHYRSKLLPETGDKEQNGVKILSESKRREELNMVLQAVFTDPADSSAWIYHKWLLSNPNQDVTKPICALLKNNQLQVAFSKAVSSSDFVIVSNSKQEKIENKEWKSSNGQKFDTLWITELVLPASVTISVKMANSSASNLSLNLVNNEISHALQTESVDQETYKVLEEELENCNTLLGDDLIDDNNELKWTKYTQILIMKAMNAEKFHDEIITGLEDLCKIDEKRKGYYQDQKSKYIMDKALKSAIGKSNTLNLSGMGLKCVYFKEMLSFFEKIDLSNNDLKCVKNLEPYLIQCKELILDGNPIEK